MLRNTTTTTRCCSLLLVLTLAAARTDPLWLSYTSSHSSVLPALTSAQVLADSATCKDNLQLNQLRAAAEELTLGLSQMYERTFTATCCGCQEDSPGTAAAAADSSALTVSINSDATDLGDEGFRMDGSTSSVVAASSSGALHGTFRYLSHLQRGAPILDNFTSIPAMEHRMWDLWDGLDGLVTRGYGGPSLLWPFALYKDQEVPKRSLLFMNVCNSSDPYQQWFGNTLSAGATGAGDDDKNNDKNNDKNDDDDILVSSSIIRNNADDRATSCLQTAPTSDPVLSTADACNISTGATFYYNRTNKTISVVRPSVGTINMRALAGACLDLNGGRGPDIDLYTCHTSDNLDYLHQQFLYDEKNHSLQPVTYPGMCLTLARTTPTPPGNDVMDPWQGRYKIRMENMLRLMKSIGMNGLVIQDVNACGKENTKSLNETYINIIAENLGPMFSKWGIKPYQSLCYGAPTFFDNVTSDPRNPATEIWWKKRVERIHQAWSSDRNGGGGFGGFLIKADSEGNIGPMMFNTTEAEGANMIARAVSSVNPNMVVIWRAFVYGMYDDEDLARQSYDTFHQLDGKFEKNVILQIKNGPMDFQIREPLHPLLGSMRKTPVMMEVQAAQEYTGQQIHMTNLVTMWKEYLDFDTMWGADEGHKDEDDKDDKDERKRRDSTISSSPQLTIAQLLTGAQGTSREGLGRGMACVSNLGSYANWTGHVMAAANFYGCGRLQWNPFQSAKEINGEWIDATFASTTTTKNARAVILTMVGQSREIYEGYQSPLGLGFMIAGNPNTNGCAPKTKGPGRGPEGKVCQKEVCYGCRQPPVGGRGAQSDHYWLNPCENYDFANYSKDAVGCWRGDKESGGTGYANMYSPLVSSGMKSLDSIDERLLLFFHNVPWDYVLKNLTLRDGIHGRTVWEYISMGHKEAVETCSVELVDEWTSIQYEVEPALWSSVLSRLQQQCSDGKIFAEVIVEYYTNLTGLTPAVVPPTIERMERMEKKEEKKEDEKKETTKTTTKTSASYVVSVLDRNPTGSPLLSFADNTSSFENILNPAWLPLSCTGTESYNDNQGGQEGGQGGGHDGGGLFFRTLASTGTESYNTIGFVRALDSEGLRYSRVDIHNLLHDTPGQPKIQTAGADPRATHRPLTGESYVTYQTNSNKYPGRHTYISATRTPLDMTTWERSATPMFANIKHRDGSTFALATTLVPCNASDASLQWMLRRMSGVAPSTAFSTAFSTASSTASSTTFKMQNVGNNQCLSYLPQAPWDPAGAISYAPCEEATVFEYDNATQQLRIVNGTTFYDRNGCVDVNGGSGPAVDLWLCHNTTDKKLQNQQWLMSVVQHSSEQQQEVVLFESKSAPRSKLNVPQCLSIRPMVPNDCATALWFPDDVGRVASGAHSQLSSPPPKTYAVATFGELRGGDLSLVSTTSSDLTSSNLTWTFESLLLRTRSNDYWDNATLSTGPAPQLLDDGNWLLLYDVDNLWPVRAPMPLPSFGRCALGWVVLDGKNWTNVLARAEEPLVYAQLPWETSGYTNEVVYVTGVKPEGNNTFLVYAGGGDRVVEAFRIQVV